MEETLRGSKVHFSAGNQGRKRQSILYDVKRTKFSRSRSQFFVHNLSNTADLNFQKNNFYLCGI